LYVIVIYVRCGQGGLPAPVRTHWIGLDWMQVGFGRPGQIVLDWDQPPLPREAQTPNFLAHICYGQMAGWIKIPLDMEVGLGPGDFVLDRDPAPPPHKGTRAPSSIFSPCPLWQNGCMDQDGTCHGRGSWSRPHCTR